MSSEITPREKTPLEKVLDELTPEQRTIVLEAFKAAAKINPMAMITELLNGPLGQGLARFQDDVKTALKHIYKQNEDILGIIDPDKKQRYLSGD